MLAQHKKLGLYKYNHYNLLQNKVSVIMRVSSFIQKQKTGPTVVYVRTYVM